MVEIEPDKETGNRQAARGEPRQRRVSFNFHPVIGRRFLTISVTIEPQDINPTSTVLKAINKHENNVRDTIVRLNINLPAEIEGQLRDNDIRNALKEAHHITIAKDIEREARLRLGGWTAEEITPLDALKAYLESKKTSQERTKLLLEYGEKLIQERKTKSG